MGSVISRARCLRRLRNGNVFSGVTFTSLGYGDVVLDGRIRLLAPLQAANGLMMFGITTALFFSAIQQAMGKLAAANQTAHEP